MKVEITQTDDMVMVTLAGRLDTVTAPDLERFLADKYNTVSAIELDFEKLAYVSSAGLRVLLGAQKKMKGAMKLKNVNELVMEVFEMTGFADILVIE